VENLLQMTRIESRGIEVKKQWEVLEEVVGSALRRLETSLRQRKVEIEIPADLPLIPMDGLLMEQVLINLLENAVKYSPKETPVLALLKKDNSAVQLQIVDEGPGIAEEEKKNIFSKFYRIGNEATRKTQGTGLGLYLCSKIARDHKFRCFSENIAPK
jgi:two-component system sensor histidine kinase KdpD